MVGIDAPEASTSKHRAGQPFSRQSTQHLSSLILNKTVDVKSYGADRNWRYPRGGVSAKREERQSGDGFSQGLQRSTVGSLHPDWTWDRTGLRRWTLRVQSEGCGFSGISTFHPETGGGPTGIKDSASTQAGGTFSPASCFLVTLGRELYWIESAGNLISFISQFLIDAKRNTIKATSRDRFSQSPTCPIVPDQTHHKVSMLT